MNADTHPAPLADHPGRLARAWRSFLALGVGNYGALCLGLLVNVLLARRLGTEQYGRLALMLMASQVLLLTAVNWSHAGFVRFGSQEFAAKGGVAETLWTRLGIVLPTAGLGLIMMAFGRHWLAAYLGIPAIGVWLIMLHFVAACAITIVGAVLQASDQMARYGVCLFLDKTVMLSCVAMLPAAWIANPLRVVACYAASSLAVATWGVSTVGFRKLQPLLPSRAAYRTMVLFSAPLLLSSWAGLFGTNWFDLIILKRYVPIAGIGTYSLATQLAGVVQQITVVFSTLLLPHLSVLVAEGQDARIRTFVERLLPYWLLGTSLLFVAIVMGARVGVVVVFGRAFAGAAPVLAALMAATSALALFNACAPLVTAYGSTWTLTGIVLLSAVSNVVLDLVLIPPFGVVGSALATVLAYATSAMLVLVLIQQRVGGRVLRLAWLAAPVIVASISFAIFDGLWFYAGTPIAVAASVLALVSWFGLFRDADVVFLKELRVPMPFGWRAGSLLGWRS